MASYNTNEFKNGLKIMLDGDPCSITENILVKPGKGQAFNRVKMKNLKTGAETVIQLSEIQVNQGVDDSMFNRARLMR